MGARWTKDDLAQHLAKRQVGQTVQGGLRPRKYRNQPITVDGITFDSKKEANRWHELKLEQMAHNISELRHHEPTFSLQAGDEHVEIARYEPDFSYKRNGELLVIEDVKSSATRTPMYRLKKKWMEAQYGIVIQEV